MAVLQFHEIHVALKKLLFWVPYSKGAKRDPSTKPSLSVLPSVSPSADCISRTVKVELKFLQNVAATAINN